MSSEKNNKFTLEYLNKNVYSKFKKKIKTLTLQVEFGTLLNLLKDKKALRTFILREMHGIYALFYENKDDFLTKGDNYIVFPKKSNETLEINEFFLKNINSNHIYINNYVFKINLIYEEEWEKYRKIIYRFEIQNKDKQTKKNIPKNQNEYINDNLHNSNNFADLIFSYYLDINDYSTILINEIYYNLGENEINRVWDILNIHCEKVKNFISKNLNIYLCFESILINRGITQTFNYIMSRKLFYNERFEVKEIQKYKDEINIYVDIKDRIYPNSFFQCRCHILRLSEISCFISTSALIDVKHFSFSKRFMTLKAGIILVLKKLKQKIESELIEN